MKYVVALTRLDILGFLKGAGRWWIGELLFFVPPIIQRYLESRRTLITADFEGDTLVIGQFVSGRHRELARVAIGEAAAHGLANDLRAAVQKASRAGAKLALRLRHDQVLRKVVEFPLSAERDLRQILGLELDLHTPAIIEDALFDYRIVQRNAKTKQLAVELALVRRDTVAQAVAAIAPLGLEMSIVGVSSGEGVQFNFVSTSKRRPRAVRERMVAACLAASALILLAVATYLQDARKYKVEAELATELAKQKSLSDEVTRLKGGMEQKTREYLFLPERKRALLAVSVLNELARLLPDNTWLFQVDLVGQQARISGFSMVSSQLIALVNESTLFANAQFRSPLTQVSGRGLERFEISFDVKQRVGQ